MRWSHRLAPDPRGRREVQRGCGRIFEASAKSGRTWALRGGDGQRAIRSNSCEIRAAPRCREVLAKGAESPGFPEDFWFIRRKNARKGYE